MTLKPMSAESMKVVSVNSSQLHEAFCDFPYQLYRGHSHWVAPIRPLEHRRWSPEHNSSLQHRWTERFLALRNEEIVGRIAAIVDPEFSKRWVADSGFFGFFECENNPETACLLLNTVERALQEQGKSRILGPVDLTTHDEVGLLIDGHASRPMVLSPYQFEYYESLLMAAKYCSCCEYHAYSWSTIHKHERLAERFLARVDSDEAAAGILIKPSTRRRWNTETVVLHELYNACFDEVWGFVPIEWKEFRERAESFRPFYRPELVVFAYKAQQPIGFALALPDINEAIAQINGRLFPLGWLRLLFAVRRIRSARFMLLGVLPEYRKTGIALRLANHVALAAQQLGIKQAELSLINQNNEQVQRVVKAFGGQRIKTYRLFEKTITQ